MSVKVVRPLKYKEATLALCFHPSKCAEHFHERVCRIERVGGIGELVSGFLVDKGHERGMEKHYITSTGLIVVRNWEHDEAVTVMVARAHQIARYYKTLGYEAPHNIMMVARYHERMGMNY